MPTFIHCLYGHAPPRQPPGTFLSQPQKDFLLFFVRCIMVLVIEALLVFFTGYAAIFFSYFIVMIVLIERCCTAFSPSPIITTTTTTVAAKPRRVVRTVTYAASEFWKHEECAIEECMSLPHCEHLFHAKCADVWFEMKPTCPICRTRVYLYSGVFDPRMSFEDRWKLFYTTVFEDY